MYSVMESDILPNSQSKADTWQGEFQPKALNSARMKKDVTLGRGIHHRT